MRLPAAALAALTLLACTEPLPAPGPKEMTNPPIRDGEFVRAEGTRFVIGEAPFRFVGANTAMIHGEAAREGAAALLQTVRDDKIGVIRVWAAGEAVDDGRPWRRAYAFRVGPDGWVETSYGHLDHLLVAARERNIRVIVTLVNRWGDYGGLPQYARWAGIESHRRHLLSAELGAVLADEQVRDLYRQHVERLLTRVNTVSGIAYRDDPTIFAWEIANELSAQSCETDEALYDWTRTMARFIRGLDGEHLIAAGHIGYKTELSRRSWRRVTALPEISFADVHAYPQNVPGPLSPADLGPWLDDRAHLALGVLGKPLVVGEIGFPRDDPRFRDRGAWFEEALGRADLDGVSGVMVWIYRSWDERRDPHGVWAAGPLAEESRAVRNALRGAAARWAAGPAEVRNDALRGAADETRFYPFDLAHRRPWTEGEWATTGAGEARLTIDAVAFAEGCGLGDGPAWLLYAADFERPGAPDLFVVEDVGLREAAPPAVDGAEGAAPDLAIDVIVDEIRVGTWNGRGRFAAAGPAALEAAFGSDGTVHWLRFEAQSAEGRAHLSSLITRVPAREPVGLVTLLARWPISEPAEPGGEAAAGP